MTRHFSLQNADAIIQLGAERSKEQDFFIQGIDQHDEKEKRRKKKERRKLIAADERERKKGKEVGETNSTIFKGEIKEAIIR